MRTGNNYSGARFPHARKRPDEARLVEFDTGERAMLIEEPFSVTYECARCKTFTADATRHSHFDGERWVPRHYCDDCLESAI